MKKLGLMLMLLVGLAVNGLCATATDTVACNNAQITKWIVDKSVNERTGKPVIKYYAIYNGKLVSTSKTVMDRVALCQKHNVACALACVRKNKKVQRIILD